MFSLAAYRYRNVLASAGGPIERVEFIETEVLGERRFLANAYLKEGLGPNQSGRSVYSGANGSGAFAFRNNQVVGADGLPLISVAWGAGSVQVNR